MIHKRLFEELNERMGEALRNSPAQDIERNLRALLAAWFDRLDLVLREDFEVQKKPTNFSDFVASNACA